MKFPGSFKVKVSIKGQPDSFMTALLTNKTEANTVAYLNHAAKLSHLPATYAVATQAEYNAYKAQTV
jgi:hypothetical protein